MALTACLQIAVPYDFAVASSTYNHVISQARVNTCGWDVWDPLPGPKRPDQEDRFTVVPDFGAELPPYARALLEGLRCGCA